MDGISDGGVSPKSCTSVTVTIDKIVVALGEKCKAGTVTGSTTTTTTSKSPGNTTATTRMTVTINNVMPQGIETMIGNNGNVGIEMGDAAGEAAGMGVQSSNRRRKEKEKKRKYHARKAGPVDVNAKIASQQMSRQLAVARRSLNIIKPNPIHGRLLVLV